jgi:hypothetical protein
MCGSLFVGSDVRDLSVLTQPLGLVETVVPRPVMASQHVESVSLCAAT